MPDAGAITSRACWSERSDEIARNAMPAASVAHAEAHLGHPIQQGPRGAQLGRLQRRPGRAANALEGNAGSATAPCVALPPTSLSTKVGRFSLHAGFAAEAHELQKLKCLCRSIARPAISEKRLSISPQGKVRYPLKTPWKNATTHVEFEPVEFIAKLAALVPPPRAHLTRFLRQRGATPWTGRRDWTPGVGTCCRC